MKKYIKLNLYVAAIVSMLLSQLYGQSQDLAWRYNGDRYVADIDLRRLDYDQPSSNTIWINIEQPIEAFDDSRDIQLNESLSLQSSAHSWNDSPSNDWSDSVANDRFTHDVIQDNLICQRLDNERDAQLWRDQAAENSGFSGHVSMPNNSKKPLILTPDDISLYADQYLAADNPYNYVVKRKLTPAEIENFRRFKPHDFATYFSHIETRINPVNAELLRETIILSQLYLYKFESFRGYIATLTSYERFIRQLDHNMHIDQDLRANLELININNNDLAHDVQYQDFSDWICSQSLPLELNYCNEIRKVMLSPLDYVPDSIASRRDALSACMQSGIENSEPYRVLQCALQALDDMLMGHDCDDESLITISCMRYEACVRMFGYKDIKYALGSLSPEARKELAPYLNLSEYEGLQGDPLQQHLYQEALVIIDGVGRRLAANDLTQMSLVHAQWALQTSALARDCIENKQYKPAMTLLDVGWAVMRGFGEGIYRTAASLCSINTVLSVALMVALPEALLIKAAIEFALNPTAFADMAFQIRALVDQAGKDPLEAIAGFTALTTQIFVSRMAFSRIGGWAHSPKSFVNSWGQKFRNSSTGKAIINGTSSVTNGAVGCITKASKYATAAVKKGYDPVRARVYRRYRQARNAIVNTPRKIIQTICNGGEYKGCSEKSLLHVVYGEMKDGKLDSGMHTIEGIKEFCAKTGLSFSSLEKEYSSNGVMRVYLPDDYLTKKCINSCYVKTDTGKRAFKTVFLDPSFSDPRKLAQVAEEIIGNNNNKVLGKNKYIGKHSSGIWITIYVDEHNKPLTLYPNWRVDGD